MTGEPKRTVLRDDAQPVDEKARPSSQAGQRDAKPPVATVETPNRTDPAGVTGAVPLRTTDAAKGRNRP
jgi:hypothetical protein